MAWLWQFKRSALRDLGLGFVNVDSALAAQLVAEGSASRVYDMFKRLDHTAPVALDPPITGVSMAVGPGVTTESPVGALVGTLSCTGGTSPFTYALENDEGGNFRVTSDRVETAAVGLTEGLHNFTVKATDTKLQTRVAPKSTTVAPVA
jgi:hypothetical protein